MKEVTYEDWQKNPTPRMMWVWDNDEKEKVQRKVVYVIKRQSRDKHPIRTTKDDDMDYEAYMHCAEIEEPKTRRMTNKELSWWLSEKPHRERKHSNLSTVYTSYIYNEDDQDKEVPDNILIREGDEEWREPLVEAGE